MYRLDEQIPAKQLVADTSEPEVGDIAIMRYQKTYSVIMHYAVVEGVFDNGDVLVSECNMWHLYTNGCGYRVLANDYQNLIGFYSL